MEQLGEDQLIEKTMRLIKKKHGLWNRFMETRDPVTERKNKNCQNAVRNEATRARRAASCGK